MICREESARDETSGDMATPGCPKVLLGVEGLGQLGPLEAFSGARPLRRSQMEEEEEGGFPSACDSPRAGPAGPGQGKDGLLDRKAVELFGTID